MYNFGKTIRNVIIIHHNDQDGYVGARAIANACSIYAPYVCVPRFIEATYSSRKHLDVIHNEPLKDTLVCIVDFSIPVDEMRYLCEKVGSMNVVWIDHHVGSISQYIEALGEELSLIPGLRISTGLCGAELAFLFFNTKVAQPRSAVNELVIDGDSYNMANRVDRDVLIKKYMPQGLKLVGDWDTFRHVEHPENRDAIALNYYFNSKEFNVYEAVDFMFYFEKGFNPTLQCAINEGKILDAYEIKNAKNMVKKTAFDCKIIGFEDIHAVAVNFNGPGSSMIFESVRDNYEVAVVYYFNGRKTKYSFYRLNENKEKIINCSKIAMSFGGGGHASAAGAVVEKNIEVIRIAHKPPKKKPLPFSYIARTVDNIEDLLKCNVHPFECVFVKDASGDRHATGIDDNPNDGIPVGAVYVRRPGNPENYKDLEWGWELCGVTDVINE